MNTAEHTRVKAEAARRATRRLGFSEGEDRNRALEATAALLLERRKSILQANAADCQEASDLPIAVRQRMHLDDVKLMEMVRSLRAVAALPDPLGQVRLRRLLDEGLELTQITCPLGVLGVIFEARPDAAIQIGALAIKTGNASLLKGGRETARTHALLAELLREGLGAAGLPEDGIQVLEGREAVESLLDLPELVDLIIPRGSKDLVRYIQARTRIPVLGHADGICHIYLDASADPAMAVDLVRDAKLQYPAACNAVETLLVHREGEAALRAVAEDLRMLGAELRGCDTVREWLPWIAQATEADWGTEYSAPVLSVKVVETLDEAMAHIHTYGSGHTEAILTEDPAAAARFLAEVDAAGVYHNASTRFADGYRYGFGAEVGISTGRLHARGPVGLEGLVTGKYLLRGGGHRVADYTGPEARPFRHRDIP